METAENEGGFQGNRRRGIPDHIGSAEAKSHSQGERPLSRALVERPEDATKEFGVRIVAFVVAFSRAQDIPMKLESMSR